MGLKRMTDKHAQLVCMEQTKQKYQGQETSLQQATDQKRKTRKSIDMNSNTYDRRTAAGG